MKLNDKAIALLNRLEREIKREEDGTAKVGGITKAGNALEDLLKEALIVLYSNERLSIDGELKRLNLTRGAGSYAQLLVERKLVSGPNRLLRALVADVRNRASSKVWAMIDVRNANNHPGRQVASRSAMLGLAQWLRPLVSEP